MLLFTTKTVMALVPFALSFHPTAAAPNGAIARRFAEDDPGIGVEFETGKISMASVSGTCGKKETYAAKKHVVAGRKGDHWQLTADTLSDADVLDAEYILDGSLIKIGSGDLTIAATDITNDLVGPSTF